MLLQGRTILRYFLHRIQKQFTKLELRAITAIGLQEIRPSFALDVSETHIESKTREKESTILDSLFGDGLLWGVPTTRRSLEKRMMRRLAPNKVYKLKKNIIVCPVCYSHHEAHTICGNCYAKVKAETEAMQEAIQKELKYEPVDKEVAIIYKGGEKSQHEGKRIVEIDRPPPAWFAQNLLTRVYMPKEPQSTMSVSPNDNANVKLPE